MIVAKWVSICFISCLGVVLGLASTGLVFGYSYPVYPKRMLQTEPMNVQTKLSKSERWNPSHAQKSGLADANPSKATEQLPRGAEFLERIDKMQFYKGRRTSHNRSWPIPQLQCKEGCDSYEPCEFLPISHSVRNSQ